MKADRRAIGLAGAAALCLLASAPADAQVVVGDSVTSFVPASALAPAIYDGGARRDPFDPLTLENSPETGPRFEALRLTGIFLGSPGNSLVVLEDPENVFLAANVVPLVASQKMSDELKTVLDAVSAKLTTEALIELNGSVEGNSGVDPDEAAQKWISDNGFDQPLPGK